MSELLIVLSLGGVAAAFLAAASSLPRPSQAPVPVRIRPRGGPPTVRR